MRTPLETLAECKTQDDVREAYKQTNIVNFTIHHETFADDLVELVTTKLKHAIRDVDGAVKHIREAPKLNTSDRIDAFEPDPTLGRRVETMLDEREWLLHELFEY